MTRRSVNETTAWCEAHIWSSMPDKETVYAYIVSAYHLRQDDAYAAVGMLRGQLKRQMPEYANDAWCDPETDFVRFVNAGAVRGALPRWWNAEHRRQAVHAQSLLGYGLLSSEEPVDFLRAFGPTEGAEAIKQLRDLGDIFEGPAAWERQTDRDQEEHRKPAIGRRESEQICHRCRAGVELPLWQGLYSFSCPYCQYSLPCPKCDAAIVDGQCAACAFQPRLYVRINSGDPSVAERAVKLAAPLELPALRWFAVGDTPDLCNEGDLARHQLGQPTMMPDGQCVTIVANAHDHLHESADPALLVQHEATLMFHAGCLLIRKALNVTTAQLRDPAHRLRPNRVDLDGIKAGAQLVVDAYMVETKSRSHQPEDTMALVHAANFLNDKPERKAGFGHSALQFFFATYHMTPGNGLAVSREMLDKLLALDTNQLSAMRLQAPSHRWTVARLLFYRSYDKLTRLGDPTGSEADLSLAIDLMPAGGGTSLCGLRAPLRLSRGDMAGAKADYLKAVAACHADDRHFHSMLFALAAMHAADGSHAAGREHYELGKTAEARHRYLYGEVCNHALQHDGVERDQVSALEHLEEAAHRWYATPEERCERLLLETGKPASQADLERRSMSVMGLPAEQVRRFNEAMAPTAAAFARGDPVMVHGLESASARRHNGALGVIQAGPTDGRYTVSVRDKADPSNAAKETAVRIKPANLQPASQAAASHQPAPKSVAAPAGTPVDPLSEVTRTFAEKQRLEQRREEERKGDDERIAQARAALTETTDAALNSSQPEGDGDQSFVREALESDPGRRLKLARVSGMDFATLASRGLLAPFAMTCLTGDLNRAQSMISLSLSSGGAAQVSRLLERRESMMRLTPLMCCITGAQQLQGNLALAGNAQHVALARALLEAGAKPNAKDVGGFTAFHLATNGNAANAASLQIAAMLPQYGGDPNVRNRFGQVPLIEAVMTTRMDVIECLVHAGADPSREDLSNANLPARQLERNGSITPISLARSQKDVLHLFSRAELSRTKMEPVTFVCAAPGCEEVGSRTCARCLRSWYCSPECQKADWKAHKPLCKLAATELTRVRIRYDTPACELVCKSRGVAQEASKPFRLGHPHTVKLQLPMFDLTEGGSTAILGYTRLTSRVFEVSPSDNEERAFTELVNAIRDRGQGGGLKGYFNAWAASESGDELDIDARCMKPPQAF